MTEFSTAKKFSVPATTTKESSPTEKAAFKPQFIKKLKKIKPTSKSQDDSSEQNTSINKNTGTEENDEAVKSSKVRKKLKQPANHHPVSLTDEEYISIFESVLKAEPDSEQIVKIEEDLAKASSTIKNSQDTKVKRSEGPQEWDEEIKAEKGTWIQCTEKLCGKWRYVEGVRDPTVVTDEWICAMNPDKEHDNCEKPEATFDERDHIFTKYTVGSIVWAKMDGFPWWPAMVDYDPDYDTYVELASEKSMVPSRYHVSFFDDSVSRAWVRGTCIRSFSINEHPTNNGKKYRGLKKDMKKAIHNAEIAGDMDLEKRIKKYGFASRFSETNKPIKKAGKPRKQLQKKTYKSSIKKDTTVSVDNEVSEDSLSCYSFEESEYFPVKTKSRRKESSTVKGRMERGLTTDENNEETQVEKETTLTRNSEIKSLKPGTDFGTTEVHKTGEKEDKANENSLDFVADDLIESDIDDWDDDCKSKSGEKSAAAEKSVESVIHSETLRNGSKKNELEVKCSENTDEKINVPKTKKKVKASKLNKTIFVNEKAFSGVDDAEETSKSEFRNDFDSETPIKQNRKKENRKVKSEKAKNRTLEEKKDEPVQQTVHELKNPKDLRKKERKKQKMSEKVAEKPPEDSPDHLQIQKRFKLKAESGTNVGEKKFQNEEDQRKSVSKQTKKPITAQKEAISDYQNDEKGTSHDQNECKKNSENLVERVESIVECEENWDSDKENFDPNSSISHENHKSKSIKLQKKQKRSPDTKNKTRKRLFFDADTRDIANNFESNVKEDEFGPKKIKTNKVKEELDQLPENVKIEFTKKKKKPSFTPICKNKEPSGKDREVPSADKERDLAHEKKNTNLFRNTPKKFDLHVVPSIDDQDVNLISCEINFSQKSPNQNILKGNSTKTLSSIKKCLTLSGDEESELKLDIEEKNMDNNGERESLELEVRGTTQNCLPPKNIFSSDDSDDELNLIPLENLGDEATGSSKIHGRFGGKCFEHGSDSDPLELIED